MTFDKNNLVIKRGISIILKRFHKNFLTKMFGRERVLPAIISFEQLDALKMLSCVYCAKGEGHGNHVAYTPDGLQWVEWADDQNQISFSQRHPLEKPCHIEKWRLGLEGGRISRVESVMVVVKFDNPLFENLLDDGVGSVCNLSITTDFPDDSAQERAVIWLHRQLPEIPQEKTFQIIDKDRGLTWERMKGSPLIGVTLRRSCEEKAGWVETWSWIKDGQTVKLKRIEINFDLRPPLFNEILPPHNQVHVLSQVWTKDSKSLSKNTRRLFTNPDIQLRAFASQLSPF